MSQLFYIGLSELLMTRLSFPAHGMEQEPVPPHGQEWATLNPKCCPVAETTNVSHMLI